MNGEPHLTSKDDYNTIPSKQVDFIFKKFYNEFANGRKPKKEVRAMAKQRQYTRSADQSLKRWLYAFIIPLALIGAVGYGYWKANPPVAIAAPAFSEQNYYSQLIYAVNEMSNQADEFGQGEWTPDEVRDSRAYVESLMAPLAAPPEELSVAQAIAEDVHASYLQFTDGLASGNGADEAAATRASSDDIRHHVELFRENAKLMKLLNAYKGVNVYCH